MFTKTPEIVLCYVILLKNLIKLLKQPKISEQKKDDRSKNMDKYRKTYPLECSMLHLTVERKIIILFDVVFNIRRENI